MRSRKKGKQTPPHTTKASVIARQQHAACGCKRWLQTVVVPTRPTGQTAGRSEAALAWQTCSQEKGPKHNASSTMMQNTVSSGARQRSAGQQLPSTDAHCQAAVSSSAPHSLARPKAAGATKNNEKSWQATKQRLHNRVKEQIVSEDICSHDRAEGGGRGRKHRHRISPRTPGGRLAGWNKPKQANLLIQRSAAAPSDVLRQDKVTASQRTGNSTFWVTVYGCIIVVCALTGRMNWRRVSQQFCKIRAGTLATAP
jgi:hypothetical protein